jgi:hypothetical protein
MVNAECEMMNDEFPSARIEDLGDLAFTVSHSASGAEVH